MRAYILSIGSELLAGNITDTNATFLAQDLVAQGIELLHVVQVGDDLPRLVACLGAAVADADLVICTGGVGPTDDDLTREAIAAVVGEEPEVDPQLLAEIRSFFASRGLTMPDGNAKQAWLIPAAEPLPNPVGTAPGWFVRHNGAIIVAMPGVPREMYRMWQEQAVPRLAPYLPARAIRSVNLRTLGIGESAVAHLLDDLIKLADPVVATYAKDDGVHVRVTVLAPTAAEADARLAPTVAEIRRRLDQFVYADDTRPLATILLDGLRARGLSLGVVEIGSGGRFGSLLLGDPGAGDVVRGALAMASEREPIDAATSAGRARDRFAAAVGLGLTAVVAPTDLGLFEGTVSVALVGELDAAEDFPLRAAFGEVQRRAALHAADVLRRALSGNDDSG